MIYKIHPVKNNKLYPPPSHNSRNEMSHVSNVPFVLKKCLFLILVDSFLLFS